MSSANICPYCKQIHREGAKFCPTTGQLLTPPLRTSAQTDIPSGITGKLQANTILNNRYVIIDKIGQGGMAAVYKATDYQQPGTVWAVKEMSDKALIDPEDRVYGIHAFQQEANLLRSLNHPNLPKVIDFFAEGSKHYFVMEFVAGETLEAKINAQQKPFPESEVLSWAHQLCDVLSYLHSQNPQIIFRDLKPGNIMLTYDGRIKLIDFGIVRFFKPGKAKDTVAIGTPGYTAPEAVSGQTDERSDIYSLCVTLHQLLTAQNPARSMFNIPPARSINPAVSFEMEKIIAKGTDNQRMLRWSNTFELRNALLAIAQAPLPTQLPVGGVRSDIIAPSMQPAASSPSNYHQEAPPVPMQPEPVKTSRPTQRLIYAATQLSLWQLIAVVVLLIVVLVGATALLAVPLNNLAIDWNLVPIMAFFGAFGYAAYPKRGMVFLSHILLTSALVGTIALRIGSQGYSWQDYALAIGVSGIVMELWAALLPVVEKLLSIQAWIRELVWLSIMEVIGMIIFFGLLGGWEVSFNPLMWGFSLLFGGIGWFLGDLIQQFILYRRTSFKRLH